MGRNPNENGDYIVTSRALSMAQAKQILETNKAQPIWDEKPVKISPFTKKEIQSLRYG